MNNQFVQDLAEAVAPQNFRRVSSFFTTGVTVTTVLATDGIPHGITLNSFTSVSLTPPLILVCIDHRSQVIPYFRIGRHFGVNVLREGQEELSRRFSRGGPDRFECVNWYAGRTGVPLLSGVLATLECVLVETSRAGDHAILLGQVVDANCADGNPLAYFKSSYRCLLNNQAACA